MADLERRLRALAADTVWPQTPDLAARIPYAIAAAPAPPARRRRWPRGRRGLLAAALALVVGGAVAAAPGVGSGLLERLGLKQATITKVTRLPASAQGVSLGLGERYSLSDARRQAGFTLLRPAALGEPDEVYLDRRAVTYLYDGPILFTQVAGSARAYLQKFVLRDARAVRIDGAAGYYLTGPHSVVFNQPGASEPRVEETRLAKNTLLWERDGLLLRLEADAPLAELLRIAQSVR